MVDHYARLTAARAIAAAWANQPATAAELQHALRRVLATCDGEPMPQPQTVGAITLWLAQDDVVEVRAWRAK